MVRIAAWAVYSADRLGAQYAALICPLPVRRGASRCFSYAHEGSGRWFPPGERGQSTRLMWMSARLRIASDKLRRVWSIRLGLVLAVLAGERSCEPPRGQRGLAYPSGGPPSSAPTAIPWGLMLADRNLWALFGYPRTDSISSSCGCHLPHGRAWPDACPIWHVLSHSASSRCVRMRPGGTFSDWLVRKKGLRWGRRLVGIGSSVSCGRGPSRNG